MGHLTEAAHRTTGQAGVQGFLPRPGLSIAPRAGGRPVGRAVTAAAPPVAFGRFRLGGMAPAGAAVGPITFAIPGLGSLSRLALRPALAIAPTGLAGQLRGLVLLPAVFPAPPVTTAALILLPLLPAGGRLLSRLVRMIAARPLPVAGLVALAGTIVILRLAPGR